MHSNATLQKRECKSWELLQVRMLHEHKYLHYMVILTKKNLQWINNNVHWRCVISTAKNKA
jgi:hypothetical protein